MINSKIKNLLISFSGGRTSGMMLYHILNSKKYNDFNKLVVFANTGLEREETLCFVRDCANLFNIKVHWLESVVRLEKGKGIEAISTDFKNASRYGQPFEAVIEKMNSGVYSGVPNQKSPYCSSRLKSIPINKYAKEYFKGEKYITAMGMRFEDMPKRISRAELSLSIEERNYKIYPLLEDFKKYISQNDVLDFWKKQSFDLQIHSSLGNCTLCYKKSEKKIINALRKQPCLSLFWSRMEGKYKTPFFRGKQYTKDLLKKAKQSYTLDLFDNEDACFCA